MPVVNKQIVPERLEEMIGTVIAERTQKHLADVEHIDVLLPFLDARAWKILLSVEFGSQGFSVNTLEPKRLTIQ